MPFKTPDQLSDSEVRLVIQQLSLQVNALEKIVTAMAGLVLYAFDDAADMPDDVFQAMTGMLGDYVLHVTSLNDHLERIYAEQMARNN